MLRLPIIVGYGGFNPAGRVSFDHAYCRTVVDVLPADRQRLTYRSLAALMDVTEDVDEPATRSFINDHTLIRRIELFDVDAIDVRRLTKLNPVNGRLSISIPAKQLPSVLPQGWHLGATNNGQIEVEIAESTEVLVADQRRSRVTSGGQLPTGYDPAELYPSRNHPRGLQLAVVGASDAIKSIGIDWRSLLQHIRPDEIAVYAGSAMGQMDTNGSGGLLQAPWIGKRPTSKQAALSLSEMPADFVNAYVSGSLGSTGGAIGACATFLYNVKQGLDEIRYRGKRIAIVGGTEAPITPELVEAYRIMGALSEDEALMKMDGTNEPDNRRACRPFSTNAGFTIAEGGVYLILMDDELALQTGAQIHGGFADVFVSADGYKKSIPGPGVGNYLTVGKALGLARAIVDDDAVANRSFIHAHGTGTPQNRVTESHILNEMAKVFGMRNWPVAAIKAYLGHTLAPASGDQVTSAIGTWHHGWIPGIATIDHVADDVHDSHLRLAPEHLEVDPNAYDVALVNSKGFGGNNATGVLLAPHVTAELLTKRHGAKAVREHARRVDATIEQAAEYDQLSLAAKPQPIYQFGEGVIEGEDLRLSRTAIHVPGYDRDVELAATNPYIEDA